MHIPKIFQQNNPDTLCQLIDDYPLGTLIVHSDDGVEAHHIPFSLVQSKKKNILRSHIAKANPLWKKINDQAEVLVIFHGPNCYISPDYYPTKKETGKAVPTWNYVALHVRGIMSYIHEEEWKREMLNQLTSQHESTRSTPWALSDAPEEYIRKMMSAIVGIEIEVISMDGQWKVSQNQPEKNQEGVIAGLSQENKTDSQKMMELIKGTSG